MDRTCRRSWRGEGWWSVNTANGHDALAVLRDEVKEREKTARRALPPLSKLRRFVMASFLMLFILQFARIKVLVGGLTGSVAVWLVKLIDPFAFAESLAASGEITAVALTAVLPVIAVYLVFGRAFCGWVCPMDFLYEMVDSVKRRIREPGARDRKAKDAEQGALYSARETENGEHKRGDSGRIPRRRGIPPRTGYFIAAGLLAFSAIAGIPFFTNYLSHLTNFFRALTGGLFLSLDLPVETPVLLCSAGAVTVLLALEYVFPRLWCRVLCPVGKTYGLFNRISLLRLTVEEGKCERCALCDQKCYMQVEISRHTDRGVIRDGNCIYCGRCVEGCATRNSVIAMKLGRKP